MKGYDTFYETPGTVDRRICQVCGTVCLVRRNQIGPTSWAGAMANAETAHDYFFCPHSKEPWHEQAVALLQAIENTPSKRIAALMQEDLVDLLTEHGCILGNWNGEEKAIS